MNKEDYMLIAYKESLKCERSNDVPVGAIIVKNGKVIAKAHNKKVKSKNCLAHAEIIAINKASKKIKDFRLTDCDLYVTKEPCIMCMGALLSARIRKIFYGASDKRFGTSKLATENQFNHKCEIEKGVLKDKCEKILVDFFKNLRG